jgi:hypothetical protein
MQKVSETQEALKSKRPGLQEGSIAYSATVSPQEIAEER